MVRYGFLVRLFGLVLVVFFGFLGTLGKLRFAIHKRALTWMVYFRRMFSWSCSISILWTGYTHIKAHWQEVHIHLHSHLAIRLLLHYPRSVEESLHQESTTSTSGKMFSRLPAGKFYHPG